MSDKPSSHSAAVLQALLVTFLWSTSWMLIKIGLHGIPALTFAGLRYSLAFLVSPPGTAATAAACRPVRSFPHGLDAPDPAFYAVTQGA